MTSEEGAAYEARVLVEQLKSTREAIEQVEQEILKLCGSFSEYEVLISIPGFGPDITRKGLGLYWRSIPF